MNRRGGAPDDGTSLCIRFTSGTSRPGRRPIVLVHGVVSGRYLLPLARALATDHAVYVPDLPGFGCSRPLPGVPSVAALGDALVAWLGDAGIDAPVVVGHSMGCHVVVDMATRHPGLLAAAVLLGPTGDPRAPSVLRHYARWLRCQGREPLSFNLLLLREIADGGVLRRVRIFGRVLADSTESKLSSIRVPTLVARGEHDHVAPDAWTQELARCLVDGQTAVVPGASHTVVFSDPAAVAKLVVAFVEASGRSSVP